MDAITSPFPVDVARDAATLGSAATGSAVTAAEANTSLPEVSLEVLNGFASEIGPDEAVIRLKRTGPVDEALTLTIDSQGAFNRADLIGLDSFETLTFAAGTASFDLILTPRADRVPEGPETASLTLLPGDGFTLTGTTSASVTVEDDLSVFGGPDVTAYWPATLDDPARLEDIVGGTGFGMSEDGNAIVTANGLVGPGLLFDGVADAVTIPHDAAFELTQGSFAVWFNPDLSGSVLPILSKGFSEDLDNANDSLFDITVEADASVRVALETEAGRAAVQGGETAPGQFQHLVVTWDPDDGLALFLDGAEVDRTDFGIDIATNANPFSLGSGGSLADGLERFDGLLDEAALFSTALDAESVSALYNQGLGGFGLVQPGSDDEPPIAEADTDTVSESGMVFLDILSNDETATAAGLSIIAVDGTRVAPGATVTLSSGAVLSVAGLDAAVPGLTFFTNGAFEDLDAGETRDQTFTYRVTNAQGLTADADVSVTVTGENDAPVAADDTAETDEDTGVTVAVLDNDADVDDQPLAVTRINDTAIAVGAAVTLGSGAVVASNDDGTLTYDPTGAFQALRDGETVVEVFTYTVDDGDGGTDTADVSVTVFGINDAPVAGTDEAGTDEDTAVTVDILANDTDAEGDDLTVTQIDGQAVDVGDTVTLASGGRATLQAAGMLVYDPADAFQSLNAEDQAADEIHYVVRDQDGAGTEGTVRITVDGLNDAPVAAADTFATNEDTGLFLDALANDTDVDDDALAITAVNGMAIQMGEALDLPSGATVTLNPDGRLLYDPDDGFQALTDGETGTEAFTYTVSDPKGATDSAEITISVDGRNDAPVAVDDAVRTTESAALSFNVLDNDTDVEGQPIRLRRIDGEPIANTETVMLASGALVTANRFGEIIYDPNGAFDGLFDRLTATDQFTYLIRDSQGAFATGVTTVTIDGEGALPFPFTAYYPTTNTLLPALFDESGNRLDGDLNGGVTLTEGVVGAGLDFNGTDGFVRIPTDDAFQLDSGAISFWFKPESFGTTQGLVSTDAFGFGDGHLTVSLTPDLAVQVRIQGPNGSFLIESAPVTLDDFHNVVVNFGEDRGLQLFVNGERAGSRANVTQGLSGNTNDIVLGASQIISAEGEVDPLIQFFDGVIDEVSIHDQALRPADIAILQQFVDADTELLDQENRKPVAEPDTATTREDRTVDIDVLANDRDGNGDPLSFFRIDGVRVEDPGDAVEIESGAIVTINEDGTLRYDPNGAFDALEVGETATDMFRYRITDEGGLRDTAFVTVTVEGGPDFPLAAYWPGETADGTVLVDASGNGVDGTLNGGARFVSDGLVGDGLRLDGFDDVAVIPHDDALLVDEGTISIWINPDRAGVNQGLVSKDASFNGTGGHFDLRLLANGQVVFRIQGESTDEEVELIAGQVAQGQWTHLAATFGEDGVRLYQDGVEIASDADFTRGLGTSSGGAGNFEPVTLGATQRFSDDLSTDPLDQFFRGRIDEVAILEEQANAAVVQALFEAGEAGDMLQPAGLLLSGDDAFDLFG
ncbi:MAG: Ig-like domain-containing protein [Alphaproteobacteria bacterium]